MLLQPDRWNEQVVVSQTFESIHHIYYQGPYPISFLFRMDMNEIHIISISVFHKVAEKGGPPCCNATVPFLHNCHHSIFVLRHANCYIRHTPLQYKAQRALFRASMATSAPSALGPALGENTYKSRSSTDSEESEDQVCPKKAHKLKHWMKGGRQNCQNRIWCTAFIYYNYAL